MRNLIQAATIIAKTNFDIDDMETDAVHNFFKIDQIETQGANFILVCCQNLDTVVLATDGDISIGSNLMGSGVVGDRTLLYSGAWTFTAETGDGAIWLFGLIPDFGIDLSDLETPYTSLPYAEYANLTASNNEIQSFRSEPIGPFIPPLIDIIFRTPVAQLAIDMNVTVYALNV